MGSAADIIRAIRPDATDDECQYVILNRTPFPFKVDPRSIYKAAYGYFRANHKKIQLCDHCHNKVTGHNYCCDKCEAILERVRKS